jgi:hypothetical protein
MNDARAYEASCDCMTFRREGSCECDENRTLPVASKPNKPCAFFNKAGGCKNGDKCPFSHILSAKSGGGNKSAAGGGAAPAPKKKVQPVNTQHTQICSLNVRTGDCPKCASGTCSFAASFEILAAAHAREIKKNPNFTVDVSHREELTSEPYNGISKSNGKIALSPATYVAWMLETMQEHKSSNERLTTVMAAAFQAGVSNCAAAYVMAVSCS